MALASATNHLTARGNTPLVFRASLLTGGDGLLSLDSGTNGTVSLDANGDIIFMPEADFSGAATFDVTVVNAKGQTSTSTITVDVAPIEQASIERSGAEFLVNTTTAGGQFQSSIAVLANGNFVVTWTDTSNGSSVRAQIVDHNGSKIGSEFVVNTTTKTNQHAPQTSALANGNFVVTWEDDARSGDVRAQIFNPSGHKVGAEFVVNTTTTGAQDTPSITALANGGFVVTWHDKTSTSGDIKAQIFGADGSKAGSEFVVNTTTKSTQTTPSITSLADGGFVVTWVDSSHAAGDKSGSAVSGQIFAADGSKTGGEFLVNAITNSDQDAPTITALTGGGFVVAWEDFSGQVGDDDSSGIVAQIFNDQGQKVGDQFLVNTTTTGPQLAPKITALADGKFVVVWDSYNNPTPDSQGAPTLLGQVLDAGSNKVGHEFQINSQPENDKTFPSIAALPDGRFVVSWTDSSGQGPDTDGFGVKAQIFTVTTTGADQAPTDETLTLDQAVINNGGKLPENSDFGTKVGVVRGIDPDLGDRLTYSLVNLDSKGQPIANGGAFAIDAKSGEVTVANKAALDFESATSHDVKVTVTDQAGLSFVKTITINLSDVNEAPTIAGFTFANGDTIPENTSNATVVGTIAATDPDAGDKLIYSLSNDANGAFTIDAVTGVVSVNDRSKLDFETAPIQTIQVLVTDKGGLTATVPVTIKLSDVNEAPTITGFTFDPAVRANNDELPENSRVNTVVGAIIATDPDAGDGSTYAIVDANGNVIDNSPFKIDANGIIRVKDSSKLDFETNPIQIVNVKVTDTGGLSSAILSVTINLSDVNEAPTDATLIGGGVPENSANGTVVGTVSGTDPDSGDVLSYALLDAAGGRFAIDADTGVITVANGSLLDFESNTSHNVTVRVTDHDGLFIDKTFTIAVANANEAPTDAKLLSSDGQEIANPDGTEKTGLGIQENSPKGAVVGTVAGVDPDAGSVFTYSLTDNAGGRFTIDTKTGVVTVATDLVGGHASLDFEQSKTHKITVQVTDQGGLSTTKTFTINVLDVNERPTDELLSNNSVAVDASGGTVIGTVQAIDPDAGEFFTYSLVDSAGNPVTGGPFAIDPGTGELSVADSSQLNTSSALSVTVRVTDKGLLTFDKTFAIHVQPKAVADHFAVDEHKVLVIPAASIIGNDLDPSHQAVVSAVGNASNGTVSLVNGVVTFTPNPNFSGVAHFDYTISNPQGGTSTATETVDVAPVSDAPTLSAQATIAGSLSGGPELALFSSLPQFLLGGFAASSALPNGGFATARLNFTTGQINAEIFDASSNLVRTETTQTLLNGSGAFTALWFSPLSNGRFAAVWTETAFGPPDTASTFVAIFDAAGNTISPVIPVSSVTGFDAVEGTRGGTHRADQGPIIAPLTDGGFVMAYNVQFFTAPPQHVQTNMIMAQRFDRNGAKVGPEFQVDGHAGGLNFDRVDSIIGLSNGGFAVTWTATSTTTSVAVARIYSPDGTLVTDDFVIAPTSTFFTSSAGLSNGELVVAYHSGGSIPARIFDSAGHSVGSEVVINSIIQETGNQTPPSITALSNGNFVVAWDDSNTRTFKVQVYDARGNVVDGVLSVGATGTALAGPIMMTSLPNGGFVVNWTDSTGHANAQVFSVSGGSDVNTPIPLSVATALTDTDSSEALTLTVDDVPVGATLTDGTHSFTATAGQTIADISKWNFGNLTITPPPNFLGFMQLLVTADSTNTAPLSTDTTSNSTAVEKVVVIHVGDEDLLNNTVGENGTTGPIVGTITGHHAAAGDTLNYTMLDDAGGRFAVDNNGVITVKNADLLGPDAANSYDITVRTTEISPAGQTSFDTVFVIEIIHANRAPDRATLKMPNQGVLPHATDGTLVGTVTGQDPDGDHPLSYTLVNSANGAFEIDRITGDITVRDASQLDGSKDILVRVTDSHGAFSDLSFTIPVISDHAPTGLTLQGGTVASFAKRGDVVGTAKGIDSDVGDTLSYSLPGSADGLFAIDSNTGAIRLAKDLDPADFNNRNSYAIQVVVTDTAGKSFTSVLTLPVAHTAPPTGAALSASTVPELVAGQPLPTGFEVGTVTGVLRDQDVAAGDSVGNYHFVDPETGNLTTALDGFLIDSNTGVITVSNPQLLDFQNVGEQDLDVWMTDRAGFVFIKTFTITLARVAGPTDATLAGGGVPANAHNGTVVGTVNPIESAQDTLEGDRVIYALTDNAEGRFAIDPTLGDISVANIDIFDFQTPYNVTVLMTDRVGNTFSKTFTIAPASEPPSLHSDLSGVPGAPVTNGNMGDNTLTGGVGKDILTGNGGNDIYTFGRGGGQDRIVNGVAANTAASGELDFGAKVSADQLWFKQSGNDLSISILGSQDRITVADWFDSSAAQLAEIKTADGLEIDSGLLKLVQGMASYSAAHPGFDPTTAPQAPNDANLQNTIAAAWHH